MEEATKRERPGKPLSVREVHFFWILDCSESMSYDGKIQSLNDAISNAIPHMKDIAADNPHAKLIVKAIKFSHGANIHIPDTPIEDFEWKNLSTSGLTDMGKALSLVADNLKIPPMPSKGYPPVLVLISDGMPTDDFNAGYKKLMEENWAKKAVRIAISIGKDADHDVLQKFIGHSEMKPLEAKNSEQLAGYIKWASTLVSNVTSPPTVQTNEKKPTAVVVPAPPAKEEFEDNSEVW